MTLGNSYTAYAVSDDEIQEDAKNFIMLRELPVSYDQLIRDLIMFAQQEIKKGWDIDPESRIK